MRLFGTHAAISLIPVLILGGALLYNSRTEAKRRAVAEAQAQTRLMADTAVQPVLDRQPATKGVALDRGINDQLKRPIAEGNVANVRILDDGGNVLYPSNPEIAGAPVAGGFHDRVSDDQRTITVYQELTAAPAGAEKAHRVGWLELTVPYGPLKAHADASIGSENRELAVGLGALYLTLIVISVSMSRGLRKEARHNAYLAEHDNLTDLPNRALFHYRAKEALKQASRAKPVAIAIIDLDGFKNVNDTLGHHNGDELLAALADRLDVTTRPEDTVARLGGDEFGVILTGTTDPEEALGRLRKTINHEIVVSSGLPLSVESSVGYVVAPDDGNDVDDLLQRADVAMYVAKEKHAGVVRYDPDDDVYDADKLRLMTQLPRAIRESQLVLHYQPKVNIADGQVDAMEALVRWQHPAQGLVYPDSFVPIAEQTDLIDTLTDWAMDQALADVKTLSDHHSSLAVAVNVSPRSLSKPDFADRVQAAIEKADVPPERLIIEITETAVASDPERAKAALESLRTKGVRVSIDDFGKGQTSIGDLPNLPVYELKIDMSFVTDMLTNLAHAAVVRWIVGVGHDLDMKVVAEGVETDAVRAGLREAGCDVAQGFLFARPMPLEDLERWLAEQPGRANGDKRARRRPLTVKRRVPVA